MRESICRAHLHRQDSFFPSLSHLEKSQTLPTGQVAMLVPVISKIHSKFCEQLSTSMVGSESNTLLGTLLPLLPAAARVPFWLSTETQGLGRSWFLQRHSGKILKNGSVVSRPQLGSPDSPWELFCGININWGMPALFTDYFLTKHVRSPARCWVFSSLS